jgi:hypothetical protein
MFSSVFSVLGVEPWRQVPPGCLCLSSKLYCILVGTLCLFFICIYFRFIFKQVKTGLEATTPLSQCAHARMQRHTSGCVES